MMLASGEIRTFTNEQSELKAVACSLGALGIILTVKIQCEKLFKLEQIEYSAKLDDVITQMNLKYIFFL